MWRSRAAAFTVKARTAARRTDNSLRLLSAEHIIGAMRRLFALVFVCACAVGQWESVPAEHPATQYELSFLRVTVLGPPELADAMAREGFQVVNHPAYKEDLELRYRHGVATLRSGGYFVDEIRGDDLDQIASRLARSKRVKDFVVMSGTVEQRTVPGM
jgi:hypothetical protein